MPESWNRLKSGHSVNWPWGRSSAFHRDQKCWDKNRKERHHDCYDTIYDDIDEHTYILTSYVVILLYCSSYVYNKTEVPQIVI